MFTTQDFLNYRTETYIGQNSVCSCEANDNSDFSRHDPECTREQYRETAAGQAQAELDHLRLDIIKEWQDSENADQATGADQAAEDEPTYQIRLLFEIDPVLMNVGAVKHALLFEGSPCSFVDKATARPGQYVARLAIQLEGDNDPCETASKKLLYLLGECEAMITSATYV